MVTNTSNATSTLPQGVTKNTISLRIGHPDPTTLLTPELQAAIQSALSAPQAFAAFQYGPEPGSPGLINFLVEKLNRDQELALSPAQVMIVAGSTNAVDMIARMYAGHAILVEAPTYVDALHVFRDHRMDICAVPVDDQGLIVADLERCLASLKAMGKSPAFLYTIPNFQNPSGVTLPLERRLEILHLAETYGFLIVEDDVYRELYFDEPPPASFARLSGGNNTLTIGSFSKIMAPGLRLGWLTGPESLVARCVDSGPTQMGGGANPFSARVVAEYCSQGYLEPHIEKLRALYKERRDVALAAFQKYMPDGVSWTQPSGGFFVWLRLPEHIFARPVQEQALQRGVSVAAGPGFFADPSDGDHNLRIAFSCAPPVDIEAGIKLLSQVIESLASDSGTGSPAAI